MLSHLKKQKLAALKEKNITLIFRLKAQEQVFKQNLKESHNRARQEKLNLMRKNCLKAETCVRFFVFKGIKTSKRDRKEETAKFVIDLSDYTYFL